MNVQASMLASVCGAELQGGSPTGLVGNSWDYEPDFYRMTSQEFVSKHERCYPKQASDQELLPTFLVFVQL